MKRWFWADLHLDQGETLVTKLERPASSPEEWEEKCIDAINLHTNREDWLYLLGDFAFRRPGYWRQRIHCRHTSLVVGNHDPGTRKIENVFGGNHDHIKLVKCSNVLTVLCHYPMTFWHQSHRGSFHLYGHIHNHPGREYVMDMMMPGRRSMDVSPESSIQKLGEFRPFSEDDVYEILSRRSGHDKVEFEVPLC